MSTISIDIEEMPDDFNVEDLPCCPLCDQPIDYGKPMVIGLVQHPFGRSFCLVHEFCIKE